MKHTLLDKNLKNLLCNDETYHILFMKLSVNNAARVIFQATFTQTFFWHLFWFTRQTAGRYNECEVIIHLKSEKLLLFKSS